MHDLRGASSSDIAWRPLRLARFTSAQAQACTALAQRAWNVPVDIGVSWRARMWPVFPGDGRLNRHPTGQIVRLRWEGGVFHMRVPSELLAACGQALVPDTPLPHMPDALVQTLLESALMGVQQALGVSGASLARVDVMPQPDPALPGLLLELQGAGLNGSLVIPMQADAEGLAALARFALRNPCHSNGIDIASTPVALCAMIGETELTPQQVATLGEGDAILIDRYYPVNGQILPLRASSGWSLLSTVEGGAIQSAAAWQADGMQASAVPDAGRVTFELGRFTLPLCRLIEATQVPTVVASVPGDSMLSIFFAGTLVGHGVLIEIDDRIAVRLTQLVARATH